MIGWDRVVGLADDGEAVTMRDQLVVATSSADATRVVDYLQDWFGDDDGRQALRLVLDGADRGVVRRDALYDFVDSLDRGTLGGGDYANLPGLDVDFVVLEFSCPTTGCQVRAIGISYDADDPPQCPVHHVALRFAT